LLVEHVEGSPTSADAVEVADVVVLPKKSWAIDCPVCPGMRIGSSLASWLYKQVSVISFDAPGATVGGSVVEVVGVVGAGARTGRVAVDDRCGGVLGPPSEERATAAAVPPPIRAAARVIITIAVAERGCSSAVRILEAIVALLGSCSICSTIALGHEQNTNEL
jgi:hypothetical protein